MEKGVHVLVLFEVQLRPDRRDAHLNYAKILRPELEAIGGFVDNRRTKMRDQEVQRRGREDCELAGASLGAGPGRRARADGRGRAASGGCTKNAAGARYRYRRGCGASLCAPELGESRGDSRFALFTDATWADTTIFWKQISCPSASLPHDRSLEQA
jgi:hypothetical protein